MNVYGVGGAGAAQSVGAATWSGASRRAGGAGAVGRMQASIGAVSQLLQMPPASVVSQLGSGQNLSSIAATKGISQDSLLSAVSRAISNAVPQGAQPLSGDTLRSVAHRIANATNVPRGFSLGIQS